MPEKGHLDLIAALRDPRLAHLRMKVTFAGHGKLRRLCSKTRGICRSP